MCTPNATDYNTCSSSLYMVLEFMCSLFQNIWYWMEWKSMYFNFIASSLHSNIYPTFFETAKIMNNHIMRTISISSYNVSRNCIPHWVEIMVTVINLGNDKYDNTLYDLKHKTWWIWTWCVQYDNRVNE